MPAAVCPSRRHRADGLRHGLRAVLRRRLRGALEIALRPRRSPPVPASGSRSASLSFRRVIAIASATTSRMPSRSSRLVVARAVRPSITGRTESCVLRSADILVDRIVGEARERLRLFGDDGLDLASRPSARAASESPAAKSIIRHTRSRP